MPRKSKSTTSASQAQSIQDYKNEFADILITISVFAKHLSDHIRSSAINPDFIHAAVSSDPSSEQSSDAIPSPDPASERCRRRWPPPFLRG